VHVSRHTQLFEVLLKSGCTQNTETDTAESSQTKIICKIGLSQKGTPIKITPALKVSQSSYQVGKFLMKALNENN